MTLDNVCLYNKIICVCVWVGGWVVKCSWQICALGKCYVSKSTYV